MKDSETKQIISNIEKTRKDIQFIASEIYKEFDECDIEDLIPKVSFINQQISLLNRQTTQLRKLKNKTKPFQVYILNIYEERPYTSKNEYIYISPDTLINMDNIILNEIEKIWKELPGEDSMNSILRSSEFIDNLEKNNIYHINDMRLNTNGRYFLNVTTIKEMKNQLNDIWGVKYVLRIHWCNKRRIP